MSKLDKLRSLILGDDLDTEKSINNVLTRVKSTLVDYTSSKYETLIGSLLNVQKNNDINSKRTNNFINDLFKDLKGITPEQHRIDRYKLIESLVANSPELGQTLSIYVDNILSPDDYLKNALVLNIPDQENIRIIIKDKIIMLLKKHKFEEKCMSWITKTLLKGDFFLEVRIIDIDNPELISDNISYTSFTEPQRNYLFNKCKRIECICDNGNWEFKEKRYVTESDLNEVYKDRSLLQENIEDKKKVVFIIPWEPNNVIPLIYQDYVLGYIVIINKMMLQNIHSLSTMGGVSTSPNVQNSPSTLQYKQSTHINQQVEVINNFIEKFIRLYPKLKEIFEEKPFLHADVAKLINFYTINKQAQLELLLIPAERMEFFKIPSAVNDPYGESIFSSVLLTGKYLSALEHAMSIYRLTRAAERRIFKIEVGADRDASNYIQQVIRKTKQKEIYLRDPYALDSLISEMNMFEDYYVPTSEGKEFFSVESLPGGELTSKIDDIEYMRKKLISGLGIPSIYLSQDDTAESKYTLSQENVKFARTIIRLQKIFTESLTSLFKKIWIAEYGNEEVPYIDNIKITLHPPMAIQMERLAEIYTNIQTTITSLTDMLPKIKKEFIVKRFISAFIDPQELEELERQSKLEPKKSEEEESLEKEEEEELAGGLFGETPPKPKPGVKDKEIKPIGGKGGGGEKGTKPTGGIF